MAIAVRGLCIGPPSGRGHGSKEWFMFEPKVAVLPVDSIEVAEGFNPRTRFDEDSLATLVASLRTTEE
jgi:hypothetical protein